jgi:putative ABC transport system ATP-binding protein/lipoprotein-releasing system ATP-binding protein
VLAGEEARSDEIHTALDLFGIVNLADRLPEQVSGGQAQRAALARAVVTRPRLLIADEPTGQLDQVTRLRVIEALMIWGRAAGCALLIASHDLEIAARVGTIWTIEHGKLTCPPRGSDARSTPDWGSAA